MSDNGYNEEYIFRTTDPLGRKVGLKKTTWDLHVVGGHNNRTELQGEEDLIKNVIEDPYFILNNDPKSSHCTRQKYLDLVEMHAFNTLKNLVIVVDHKHGIGDIVTIIPKSRVNQESTKGGPIYVRSKSNNR